MGFTHPSPLVKIHEETTTLTQGTTTSIDVGAAQDDQLLVATGFESDPNDDEELTVKIEWDDTNNTHEVGFEVAAATANPEITFTVFKVR